jgi:apolipoprotein D and lipocalin family protein
MIRFLTWSVLLGLPLAACTLFGGAKHPPLETVASVDLARYMGTWHEIARLPAPFQEGCVDSSADYRMRDDGRVEVVNRCVKEGKPKEARGIARVVDTATRSKLKVSFFRPFWGDYWVTDLDPGYAWVVVGTPDRRYLWILARETRLDEATYRGLVDRAASRGFDVSRLIRAGN